MLLVVATMAHFKWTWASLKVEGKWLFGISNGPNIYDMCLEVKAQ